MPGRPLDKHDRLKLYNTKFFYQTKIQARSCPDVQGSVDWCECCNTTGNCQECNVPSCAGCIYKPMAYGNKGICTTTNNRKCTMCGRFQEKAFCEYKECLKKKCPLPGWEGYRASPPLLWSTFRTKARADPVERFQRCYESCQGNRTIIQATPKLIANEVDGGIFSIKLCIRPHVNRSRYVRFHNLPKGIIIDNTTLKPSTDCVNIDVTIAKFVEGTIRIPFKLNKLTCSFELVVVPPGTIGSKIPTTLTMSSNSVEMIRGSRTTTGMYLNYPIYNTSGVFTFTPALDVIKIPSINTVVGETYYMVNIISDSDTVDLNLPIDVRVEFNSVDPPVILINTFTVTVRPFIEYDVRR